jgi:hypothetical protein
MGMASGRTSGVLEKHDESESLISGGTPSTQSISTQKSRSPKAEGYPGNTHYGGLRLNI